MGERDAEQEWCDRLYWSNGPCCAGCDHWSRILASAGECTKAAPVGGRERIAMMGLHSCSLPLEAGHPMTPATHKCGDFKDEFDWSTLSPWYLRSIGYRAPPPEPSE